MMTSRAVAFALLFVQHQVLCVDAAANSLIEEAQGRIKDSLFVFLSTLVTLNDQMIRFRERGVFPNDLAPPDREAFFLFKAGLTDEIVYFASEAGMFVGSQTAFGLYREPGNSGYTVDDPEMQHHFNSCVDASGNTIECLLPPDSPYIEYSCEEEDCNIWKPCENICMERGCSEDTPALCRQYSVERFQPANSSEVLGYVPRNHLCLTFLGQPSEERGEIIAYDRSGTIGDCIFPDGVTPVQRRDSGPFAYCGDEGTTCDNTFLGAFFSEQYDPRYRVWYVQTKQLQVANWSPIYLFQTRQIGITFSTPLFQTTERGVQFYGVLAVDYVLDDISSFLADNYGDEDIYVAVYVDEEPYNVIGTSTGSQTFKGVLKSDRETPCRNDNDLDCVHTTIPISQMTTTATDRLLARAHKQHLAAGFPIELIATNVADESLLESKIYVTHTVPYNISGTTLRWRVIIASPGQRASTDRLIPGTVAFGALIIVATVGFFICLYFFWAFYSKRTQRAIIQSDWRFTCAFIAGAALFNLTSFTLLGESTNFTCGLRAWSFHVTFAAMISPLLVKTWRLHQLAKYSERMIRHSITNARAALYCLPLVLLQFLLLTVITIVSPRTPTPSSDADENGVFLHYIICSRASSAFLIIETVVQFGTVFAGCVLAYKTRNLDRKFGESRQLIFAMYNIALVSVISILITCFVDINESGNMVLQAALVFWMTVFSTAAFAVPRLLQARDQLGMSRRRSSMYAMRAESRLSCPNLEFEPEAVGEGEKPEEPTSGSSGDTGPPQPS